MRSFVCFFLLLLFSFGCQKKSQPIDEHKQILRLNIHTEPPTLDARKATDTSSISVISMCFEGLMKRSNSGEVIPAIAKSFKVSKDHMIYTFHLRDAKWWDGKSVTAHDFETTWKTILDPKFPSGFANDLYILKNANAVKTGILPVSDLGVKALDTHTLRVELEYAAPYFLDLTASHSFLAVPAHITKNYSEWAANSGPLFVGNGPFKMDKWKHHNFIHLVKNETYWDQSAVTLDELDLSIIEDVTTELNMFESDELDWAGYPLSSLPTDALQALAETDRLKSHPVAGTYYYIFNVQKAPFDNQNFRRAFALAINRQSIIDNITQSQQTPATGLVPPTIWEINPHFKDHDVQEARRLFDLALKEMGYTYETLPPITLTYNSSEAHHKIAQAIQEQWFRAFGLRVRLANKEWKVFLDELSHKQFQIARMGGVASYEDAMTFFDLYKYPKSSNNFSGWGNPRFTELINLAERMPDQTKRELLLREAENILIEEMPIAPIYYYRGAYIKKNYVKDVELSAFSDANFKFAFLEN